jgi:predicted ATPase
MILRNLGIRHFRSLYDAELSLKPLTIVIGPNASGKTNLFKALHFLSTGIAGDAKEWRDYESQLDDLLWYGSSPRDCPRPDHLLYELTFAGEFCAEYHIDFAAIGSLEVSRETLRGKSANDPEWKRLILRRGDVVDMGSSWPAVARSQQNPVLRDLGPALKELTINAVYHHISGWRFFNADPRLAREGRFIPPKPESVPPLERDASNLSAFLYALARLRPDDFEAVVQALRRSIDLPQNLRIEHDAERGGNQARYRFVETPFGDRPIPPESMSDGTIRLLAHLALLLADDSFSLACLEEPDAGLHPRLMLHLADALRQAVGMKTAVGKDRQILVTTHSPELMDCFDLADESEYLQVYVAERDETGQTRFIPTSAQELAPWLEKYRLGEAVRRRFV